MTEQAPPPAPLPRNPLTQASHRRALIWQIFFPVILGIVLVAALAVGLGLLGVGDTSRWADISVMWLLLPLIILSLIPLALLIGLIVGVAYLLRMLPGYAYLVQGVMARIARTVRRGADRAVEPILRISSTRAGWKAARRTAMQRGRQPPR